MCSSRQRLDERPARIPRSRSGTRDAHAQAAGHARVRIGHVGRTGFAARGNAPNHPASHQRIEDRHVVDADHPERRANAGRFEKGGDHVAGDDALRHSGSVHRKFL
jgi:hypothetical protein